jgi:hypothetical protein
MGSSTWAVALGVRPEECAPRRWEEVRSREILRATAPVLDPRTQFSMSVGIVAPGANVGLDRRTEVVENPASKETVGSEILPERVFSRFGPSMVC